MWQASSDQDYAEQFEPEYWWDKWPEPLSEAMTNALDQERGKKDDDGQA